MSKKFNRSISIGHNIFLMTFGAISLVLFIASIIFFAVFSNVVSNSVETQAKEINKQIVLNFEGYINNILETANYIQYISAEYDITYEKQAVESIYKINTDLKSDLVSIFLFNIHGEKLIGPTLDYSIGGNVSNRPWFTYALEAPDIFTFLAGIKSSSAESKIDNVITVSRRIIYNDSSIEKQGVLLIELNYKMITDLAKKTNLGQYGHLLILDDKGTLLYTSESGKNDITSLSAPLSASLFLGGKKSTFFNTDMYVYVNTLMYTRWSIATISNMNEIKTAMRSLKYIILLIYSVTTAISAGIAVIISMRISQPINQLKKGMLRVEMGDFTKPVNVSGQREIVSLAESFNAMIDKISELLDRLVQQQKEKRKMELRVLQNQINPHFLYNTLDSIVWLAENNRNEDVVTTVVALAHFFRISISKGAAFITVEQEIAHIKNYLTIQNIRYVKSFSYEIDIDEAMHSKTIMKLTLQPIVENAIYHGVGGDEKGLIKIKGFIQNNMMIFEVWNSGYGIEDSKIEEIYKTIQGDSTKPSVGMRNVYQRLKLYYGECADIKITSVLDESTSIFLYIPFEPKGDINA